MRLRFTVILLLMSATLWCQKQGKALIDSLLTAVVTAVGDTAKVKIYIVVADRYIDIDLDKATQMADSAAALIAKTNWPPGIATLEALYGNIANFSGNYKKATTHFAKALAIYQQAGNKHRIGIVLNALGKSYEGLGDYSMAAKYHFEALHIYEGLPNNDLSIGNTYSSIAVIYYYQKDLKKSLEYSQLAIQKQTAAGNKTGVANELCNMADTYFELKDSIHAADINMKALALYKELGNKQGEATILLQLGKLHRDNHAKSLLYAFRAAALFEALNSRDRNAIINVAEIGKTLALMVKQHESIKPGDIDAIGLPATKEGMLQLAEKYVTDAIAMSTANGDKDLSSGLLADLAEINALHGHYESAYLHFRDYHHLQDSIYSQESKNKIASLETEKAINLKNKEIEINKLAIANQRKTQIGLIAGLLLLGVIGGLLFWQSRTRKKTNTTLMVLNNQLDDANKVKARFFAILSHDLRGPVANLISFLHLQKEEPGLLSSEQVAVNQQKITHSAESLLETMEAMLLWSKGQMENFTPEIKPVPVHQLFKYIERFFADTTQVQLSFKDPGNMEVNTDENYLQTIMQNLTANAVKALKSTAAGQIEWKAVQEGGKTYLSITDNGPGIKEEQSEALFDEAAVANTKYGLGLHLVRDLAKAIHCKISVTTAPGAGTTFTLAA